MAQGRQKARMQMTTPTIHFDSSFASAQPHLPTNGHGRSAVSRKTAAAAEGAPIITFGTTNVYTLMYWDKGSGATLDGAFYRPSAPSGYFILGDYAQGNYQNPSLPSLTIKVDNDDPVNPVLMPPIDFVQIWNDKGSGAEMDGSIWMPVAPQGYVALGAVSQTGYNAPDIAQLRCMRFDLVKSTPIGSLIWNDQGSGADEDVEIYSITGLTTFYAQGNYNPPSGPVWIPRALSGS